MVTITDGPQQTRYEQPMGEMKCQRVKTRERQPQELKEYYCSNCDVIHPRRRHTTSLPDTMKRSILNGGIPPKDTPAASCRFCNEPNEDGQMTRCGACGSSGGSIHCFSHCQEFILATPDSRLKHVRKQLHNVPKKEPLQSILRRRRKTTAVWIV